MRSTLSIALFLSLGGVLAGCGGAPATPFDAMKTSTVTVYRLQNYEPQASTTGTTGAVPGAPSLPPQIQTWLGAGASMLPPGLIPPGLLPGTQATAATADSARFNGYRILAQNSNLADADKAELADIMGYASNFDDTMSACSFAEFGVREERVGFAPVDLLVSLSCDKVIPVNFAWPHKNTGLSNKSVERFTKLMRKVWGG